jgi:hypothetical protein
MYAPGLEAVFIPTSVTDISSSVANISQNSNLTIYCEATEKPEGWVDGWNGDCPVVWGATVDTLKLNEKIDNLTAIDRIASIDEWYGDVTLDEYSEDGLAWTEEFAFYDSND